MRVFLDTNVLVSAFASRGLCADLFEVVLLEHELVVGEHVLLELRRALRDKLRLPVARCTEIVDFVADEAVVNIEGAPPLDVRADAPDALVLGEAKRGEATMFVTGDAALQKLGAAEGIEIVSPRRFWEALQARKA